MHSLSALAVMRMVPVKTSATTRPLAVNVGIEVTRNRVVRVCDRRHVGSSTRAEIGREFCPAVAAGTLAPAPFLD